VDGLSYSVQSAGEFVFADSDRYGVHVQARFTPAGPNSNWSYVSRIALEAAGSRVEFDNQGMYVDGVSTPLDPGHFLHLGERTYILRTDNGAYLVLFNGLHGAFLSWHSGGVGLYVPRSADSDLVGLMGNADGDPNNDLRLSDGTQLPANASPQVLHTPTRGGSPTTCRCSPTDRVRARPPSPI
jgi:hypothetical protein